MSSERALRATLRGAPTRASARAGRCAAWLLLAAAGCATTAPPCPDVTRRAAASRLDADAAPPPPAARAPEPSAPSSAIARELDALLDGSPALRGTTIGVRIERADGGLVYERDADARLVPASSMKLLTTMAALHRLGPEHRFRTRVGASKPARDGVLEGDLVIVGEGDPSIGPRLHAGDPWAVFAGWAAQLRAAGVRSVRGRLVLDRSRFEGSGRGRGWESDDENLAFAAPFGPLVFHESTWRLEVRGAARAGDRARVTAGPAPELIALRGTIDTIAQGGSLRAEPGGSAGTWRVSGAVAKGRTSVVELAVDDPTAYFGAALRLGLARAGVDTTRAEVVIEGEPRTGPPIALFEHASPPLRELVRPLLEHSVNLYAEALLVALSEGSGPASARAGVVGLRRALAELGVDPSGWSAVDGSGLSRHDLASARALTTALSAGLRAPFGPALREALPLAGRSGTLTARMKGTPLEGRVRAKTGSMTGVRALAGELTRTRGEPLVFAFVVNGITAEPRAVDETIERALTLLADGER